VINMKKIVFFSLLFIVCNSTFFAQKKQFGKQFLIGTEIGFTGGLGISSIHNQNMRNDLNITSNDLLTDKRYGFRASVSRIAKKPNSSMISIYGEYVYNIFQADYNSTVNVNNIGTYNKKLSFKTLDYIFAARYIYFFENAKGYYGNPIYFDLGLGISNIQALTETNSGQITTYNRIAEDYSFQTDFAPNTKSLIIGAGMYRKHVTFGFRFYYGIDNLMNEGFYLVNDGVYDDVFLNNQYLESYINYTPTKKISLELKLEINLSLFSYGRCDMSRVGWSLFKFPIEPGYFWRSKI